VNKLATVLTLGCVVFPRREICDYLGHTLRSSLTRILAVETRILATLSSKSWTQNSILDDKQPSGTVYRRMWQHRQLCMIFLIDVKHICFVDPILIIPGLNYLHHCGFGVARSLRPHCKISIDCLISARRYPCNALLSRTALTRRIVPKKPRGHDTKAW